VERKNVIGVVDEEESKNETDQPFLVFLSLAEI